MKKITDGKTIKTNAIPTIKSELKVSKNSTNGSTEPNINRCKIIPSNLFNVSLLYDLKMWWIKEITTQSTINKNWKMKSLDGAAIIWPIDKPCNKLQSNDNYPCSNIETDPVMVWLLQNWF